MARWIFLAGITALLVTGYFATMFEGGRSQWRSVAAMPVDLQKKAQSALARGGANWAEVRVEGQVATVSGVAPTEADRDDIKQLVRAAAGPGGPWWGGITQVHDAMEVAQPKKPYIWSAVLGADRRISLSGYVPGQRYHQAIRAEARKLFPTGVDDQMNVASGNPTGAWDETAVWALRQLAQLQSGDARFVDAVITIRGQARDGEVQAAIYEAAKKVQRPYQGAAEITLSSAVPLPNAPEPSTAMATAPEAPAAEAPAETTATAPPPTTPAAALAASPTSPQRTSANCQKLVDQAMADNTVEFARGSANVKKTSLPMLDRMAKTASSCGTLRFRITGHTDGSEDEAKISDLGQSRAERVAMYLEAKGVARDRMMTVGAGSSQPVADSSTSEGQELNRRAEISVLP